MFRAAFRDPPKGYLPVAFMGRCSYCEDIHSSLKCWNLILFHWCTSYMNNLVLLKSLHGPPDCFFHSSWFLCSIIRHNHFEQEIFQMFCGSWYSEGMPFFVYSNFLCLREESESLSIKLLTGPQWSCSNIFLGPRSNYFRVY